MSDEPRTKEEAAALALDWLAGRRSTTNAAIASAYASLATMLPTARDLAAAEDVRPLPTRADPDLAG